LDTAQQARGNEVEGALDTSQPRKLEDEKERHVIAAQGHMSET